MTTPSISIHGVAKLDIKSQRDLGTFVARDIVITTDDGAEITIELFTLKQDTIKVEIN